LQAQRPVERDGVQLAALDEQFTQALAGGLIHENGRNLV